MSERQSKATQDKHERILNEIVKQPGNELCADCRSKSPRWASYSLGVFLCIRCAGIHRKMGTHVSKVKSITMDQWNMEQIEMMRSSGGNNVVNSKINPNPGNHPLPLAADDEHAMERYIRAKWEKRLFLVDNRIPQPMAKTPVARLQVLPKRSSSVPTMSTHDPLATAIHQLREMGFKDDMKNKQVLIQTQGNIEAAIEIITRNNAATTTTQPPPQLSTFSTATTATTTTSQPNAYLTDEQKIANLTKLGFTDRLKNLDALRRAGGNVEIAITILNETKLAGQVSSSSPQVIDFRSNSVPVFSSSSNNNDFLVNVDDTPTKQNNGMLHNPFSFNPSPLLQQQQQQQTMQQMMQPQMMQPQMMQPQMMQPQQQSQMMQPQQMQQQQMMQSQLQQQQIFNNPFGLSNQGFNQMSNPFSQMTTTTTISPYTMNNTPSYFQPEPQPMMFHNNQPYPHPWQ